MIRFNIIICGILAASISTFGAVNSSITDPAKNSALAIIANSGPISPDEAKTKTDYILSALAPAKTLQIITPQAAQLQANAAVKDLETLQQYSADRSFERGEWEKTVSTLDKSIVLNNEGVEKYAVAGWLLWSTGKHEEAINYYNKMILANPNNPDAYFEYGFYYFTQKNDQEAARWFQTAVALGLTSPKRHMYGHTLKRLGLKDEALKFWNKVLAEEPGNEIARKEVDKLLNPTIDVVLPEITEPKPDVVNNNLKMNTEKTLKNDTTTTKSTDIKDPILNK